MALDKDFYKRLRAQSKRFTGALLRDGNLLVLAGVCMYIAYLVMALKFYWPSFVACMGLNGDTWFVLNVLVQSVFLVALFLWTCSGIIPATVAGSYGPHLPVIISGCGFYFLVVYALFYAQCANRKCAYGLAAAGDPDTACADVEELTHFNSTVLKTLNGDSRIDVLYKYYKKNAAARISIGSCSKYYSGAFLQKHGFAEDADIYSELNREVCDPDVDASVTCNYCEFPGEGSPTLSEFFVMTSARTCVVGDQYDGYVSPRMILVALTAGARCLDFDVSNYGYAIDAPPIVSVFRDRDNTNLMRNFVLLETCFRTIMDWRGEANNGLDPLFLRLNFRRGLTAHTMSRIADMLHFYFSELDTKQLLGSGYEDRLSTWSFRSNVYGSLGQTPICLLFKRIVIMVHSPFVRPPDRLLDLVNAYNGAGFPEESKSFQHLEWKEVVDFSNKDRLRQHNKRRLTYVDPSYAPYSDASPVLLPGEGGLYNDPSAKYSKNDGAMALMMNKQTINNDAVISLKNGCQFVAMNVQNTDTDLALYMSLFYRSSLMLKPHNLRRRIPKKARLIPKTGCKKTDLRFQRTLGSDDTCTGGFEFICVPKDHVAIERITEELTNQGWTRHESDDTTCIASQEEILALEADCSKKTNGAKPKATTTLNSDIRAMKVADTEFMVYRYDVGCKA
jgi:hypothetical protein